MKNRKTLLTVLAALPVIASAQSIEVNAKVYDFGQVKYEMPSTATLTLKNKASVPVKITEVETGCGCMEADYPKGEIAPGESVKMSLTYDSHLLGHFHRSVLIYDDKSEAPAEVAIKGNVVLEVENFSGEYPVKLGDLLADTNSLEFDDVNKGDRVVGEIHIMNPTGQYVTPAVMRLPSYMRAEIVPSKLAPKKAGVVKFIVDSKNIRLYGLNQTSVYLGSYASEKISEDKEISISTVLLPPQIAQDDAARLYGPKMQLSTTTIDFSDFAGKSKKKSEIVITNNGRTELDITTLQMFTPGLQVTLPKRKLAAGESTKMKITGVASVLKKVKTRPRILMITNDPDNQKVVIEIKK